MPASLHDAIWKTLKFFEICCCIWRIQRADALSSFSFSRTGCGSGKQCLVCTWHTATRWAYVRRVIQLRREFIAWWLSSCILWSLTSRWSPFGQHGGLHPLLRLLARCFRRMLSPGRILSSNASVTSVLVSLFCLLVALLPLPGTKWSLLAWSLATN